MTVAEYIVCESGLMFACETLRQIAKPSSFHEINFFFVFFAFIENVCYFDCSVHNEILLQQFISSLCFDGAPKPMAVIL